jgi:hypothetical protein
MAKKIRFRNRDDGLRVIYDESGTKKELVPGGTVLLDPEWAGRFRCLERTDSAIKTHKQEKPEEKMSE